MEKSYAAKIAYQDEKTDLAVIVLIGKSTEVHSLPFLQLAPSVDRGAMAFCAGFRLGEHAFHISTGVVASSADMHEIVINAITDEGVSGGPVISTLNFFKLLGVIRRAYGARQISTGVIPPLEIYHSLEKAPSDVPRCVEWSI